MALFRAVDALPLRQVQPGADFNERGGVRKAEFVGRGHALVFTLTVEEAPVPDSLAPIPVPPTPTVTTPPPPNYFGSGAP